MATTTRTTRSPAKTVEALLRKVVSRGATAAEQDASVGKARELVAANGLDPTAFEWPPERIEGPKGRARTVQAICVAGIVAGLKNAEVIAAVRAELGAGVRTSPGCVGWYRSKLKKGVILPDGTRAPRRA